MSADPIHLEPAPGAFCPHQDKRPRMEEPLPVKLVTIEDARLLTAAGLERDLDAFYADLLGFRRLDRGESIVYRSETHDLIFVVEEPPVRRDSLRALGIEIPSLADLETKLVELQIEFTRQRGLLPGHDALTLSDPAGNWLELVESRPL
jgi:catechol-2,3-dioxygenase